MECLSNMWGEHPGQILGSGYKCGPAKVSLLSCNACSQGGNPCVERVADLHVLIKQTSPRHLDMARVTAEDCVLKVPNRFELVMRASQRAREIGGGMTLTIDRDNDKNPVVALREIAEETVVLDELRESLVRGHQKVIPSDEHEDEIIDLMEGEAGWVRPDGERQTLADEGMIDQDDEGELSMGDDANLDEALDDDEESTPGHGQEPADNFDLDEE